MADIFISYIQDDERVVAPLHNYVKERLGRQHTICLSAETRLYVERQEAREQEAQELGEASVILLMFSQQSIQSPWVHVAADMARRTNKIATYLCFWDLAPTDVAQRFAGTHAFDLRTQLELLLTSMAHHLSIPPPLPVVSKTMLTFQRLRDALKTQQPTS